jgi:diacylglycerol O-acyltransferase / wax synthase
MNPGQEDPVRISQEPPAATKEIPLTDEDVAILELESDTVAGHTCKVIRIAPPGVRFDALYDAVTERVRAVPELTRLLGGTPDAPAWTPDSDFRLSRHLSLYGNGHPVSDAELRVVTSRIFAEKLDRAHPLWKMEVVNTDDGGTALIWRIHHVMADGSTAMRMARQILWDAEGGAGEGRPEASNRTASTTEVASGTAAQAGDERRRRHLLSLFEREFARAPDASPFDGPIGHDRVISFATVSLRSLHDSARSLAGATLNDAVLSVIAGALRHWMELHRLPEPDQLRVKVPVSLHHGDDDLGNRDSFFSVPLPLGEPDPVIRLKAIREATDARKQDHDAEELDSLMRRVSHVSKRLAHLLAKVEANPRRFALNVSNVKGPKHDVSVLGTPVSSVHSIVEIGEHHALRIAVVSVGDRLCFGFCADPDLVTDLDELATGAEQEAARLAALAA